MISDQLNLKLALHVRKLLFRSLRNPVHSDMLPGSFFGPPNLIELLRHRADHQGSDTAFAFLSDGETESERVTYRDLERRARAVGAQLQSMGMEGERALLLFPSGPEFVAAFFG